MAIQKERKLCVDCKKEEVFQGQERFDRCYSCARAYSDKMQKWYITTLITHEQLVNFGEYKAAEQEFTSMIILD